MHNGKKVYGITIWPIYVYTIFKFTIRCSPYLYANLHYTVPQTEQLSFCAAHLIKFNII